MSDKLNPQFVEQVQKIRAALDTIDYYQLLRIPHDAVDEEIRTGYHEQARKFHPDRYAHFNVEQLTTDLTAIAKRITEAYVVLRDVNKRRLYLDKLNGEEVPSSLRFREEDERTHREVETSRAGTTKQGRDMYQKAMKAFRNNDKKGAVQSLKMALVYERDNQAFKDLLAAWERE